MTEKNKLEPVSKEMMDELDGAKDEAPSRFFVLLDKNKFEKIKDWLWKDFSILPTSELTKRESKLIKHIWLNDPQFEEEKTNKYVVRSIDHDGDKHYKYLIYSEDTDLPMYEIGYDFDPIVKFVTREEAEKWTNPQTEVVEAEE